MLFICPIHSNPQTSYIHTIYNVEENTILKFKKSSFLNHLQYTNAGLLILFLVHFLLFDLSLSLSEAKIVFFYKISINTGHLEPK